MFHQRPSVCFALIFASFFYSSIAYSFDLVDKAPPAHKPSVFVSIQNATLMPVSMLFSNGEAFEIPATSGKLIPCAKTEGVVMFINSQTEKPENTHQLFCGHSYTILEDTL